MKNKKTFITVCIAAICLAVFFITKPMLKDINGEEYFNFAQFNEEYAVYVIRENKEVQDFTDGEHGTEHKEYLLNEEQTVELRCIRQKGSAISAPKKSMRCIWNGTIIRKAAQRTSLSILRRI